MSILDFILKKAVPVPKVTQYDRYLFIGAHPDDIEIGAGSTAALLAEKGKQITFLICTDGRYGSETLSPEELIPIRQQEAIASAKMLGVSDVRFLPFSDGGGYDVKDLTLEIIKVICDCKPDMIFTIEHTLPNELHEDHLKCGYASSLAFGKSGNLPSIKLLGLERHSPKAIAYYYTHRANRRVRVSKYRKLATDSVLAHKSQFPIDTPEQKKGFAIMKLYMHFRAFRHGLRCFARYADGYRVLSRTFTHCAPEADRFAKK